MNGDGKEEQHKIDLTPIGMMFDPMEQMRELLFGATKRETDKELAKLEQKLEAMRNEFAARCDALDARLAEYVRDAQKGQAESLAAIGGALTELGERIKAMSEKTNV
ncbi:hypothetical protein [Methylocystis parvus]|uniref:hypothetical protein n=1 Tax=Methylocystis parvus TaxID=134 RepID=UPI003C792DE6